MDNENKWEYDYSAPNNSGSDTGYPNVGSSGMNTANTASQFEDNAAEQASAGAAQPETQSGNGGSITPPPAQPAGGAGARKNKKHFNGKKFAKSAVALVLVAAVGFAGGFAGGKLSGGGTKVVMQTVEHTASSSSSSEIGTASTTSSGELSLSQVASITSPSVVAITTEQVVYSQYSWYGQSQVQSGAGSGVIISSDGYILTCAHVVSGASNITVTVGSTDYTATVVGEDDTSDIAVIKIEATGLTPASVGDSDALTIGDGVIAVGNPLGKLSGTVTKGIISALNRDVSVNGNKMTLIQTDASINPGNSGGGLFNMKGELIGIVNARSTASDAEGLGFAIPINTAVEVAQQLIENGYVTGRPYMGITYYAVTNAMTAQQLGVSNYGVYVVQVIDGGPAEKAGIESGDRIVSINGTEINEKTDMSSALESCSAGDTIDVIVSRDGQLLTLSLTLGEKTADNTQTTQTSNG